MSYLPVVIVVGDEPLASSLTIAEGMCQSHAGVIKLIRKHQSALGELGRVGFEIQPFATSGGQQSREVVMLNERQAAFLISLMRNTEKVVAFKLHLISEFYRMRDALHQRTHNLWQQMHAAIAQEVESKVRASFGSRLMTERCKEIPLYRDEIERLEAELQPDLLGFPKRKLND